MLCTVTPLGKYQPSQLKKCPVKQNLYLHYGFLSVGKQICQKSAAEACLLFQDWFL